MKKKKTGGFDKDEGGKIIRLSDVRSRKRDSERREVERYFLREMIQAFCAFDSPGEPSRLFPIELLEASETGFSFRVPYEMQDKLPGDSKLRIYFSRDTYLYIGFAIENSAPMVDQGRKFMRYGCSVDQTFSSYPAYQQLIRFVGAYIEMSKRDKASRLA